MTKILIPLALLSLALAAVRRLRARPRHHVIPWSITPQYGWGEWTVTK